MADATWTDGKRTVKGRWEYYRPGDFFTIVLDAPDRLAGKHTRSIRSYRDEPEWGNFKLIRPEPRHDQ
jgi:hypothetical protein